MQGEERKRLRKVYVKGIFLLCWGNYFKVRNWFEIDMVDFKMDIVRLFQIYYINQNAYNELKLFIKSYFLLLLRFYIICKIIINLSNKAPLPFLAFHQY